MAGKSSLGVRINGDFNISRVFDHTDYVFDKISYCEQLNSVAFDPLDCRKKTLHFYKTAVRFAVSLKPKQKNKQAIKQDFRTKN